MLIDEALSCAAQLLGLSEAQQAISDGKAEENEDVKKLLIGLNFVMEEIGSDYFPLKKTQLFEAASGRVLYEQFERAPTAVYSLKADGNKLAFRRQFDGLKLSHCGNVEIEYSFKPAIAVLGGDTEWKEDLPSLRILAYGTAAEYAIASSMSEEAVLWDKRYRDALERALRQKNAPKLRARGWY